MTQASPRRRTAEEGRRLLNGLLWDERRAVAATLVLSALAAALEGLGVGLLVPLLQSITDPAAAPLASGIGWVDRWILAVEAEPMQRLYHVSAAVFGSIVLRSAFGYAGRVASIRATERVLHDLRMQVFAQLGRVELRFYTASRGGDLVNTITTELQRLRLLFSTAAGAVIRGLLLVAYISLALTMSWRMTAVAVGFLVVLSLGLRVIIRRTERRGRVIALENGRIASAVSEVVAGIRTVKAFGAEPFETARFRQASADAARSVIRTGQAGAAVRPLSEALASAVLVGLIVVSVQLLVAGGRLTVPTLLTFLFAIFRMLPIVHDLNNMRGVFATVRGSWEHVVAFLDRADKPALASGSQAPGPLREGLRLDGVSFAYEPGVPVLRDVSLTIGRGQTVALVGASGAGKSSLVDLLARFADPTAGAVRWDGVDLRELDLAALRARIGMVSQDTFLFHDTVAANIAYGVADAPRERVVEAARQSSALEFIEGLPDGLETVLGDRGVRLSGGQRQRLAIARALFRDPELLILDEATSALDSVSERLIQASLDRLRAGRTVVVVAHRLSTIESADLVVVLEAGRVVEAGTYAELVARRGHLWEFHRLQTQPVAA